ncbi:hypothetical protein BaRGS_00023166 [Batillaria attramentaria]|uniref:Uncharacterized protein n=1 Tax=Batillaria attramentaria TaxID=370345 RepID=A0ABD0KEK7_9CAEN
MGRKIVVVSIVALVAVIWSSLVVGVHSSALDRIRRQSDTDGTDNTVNSPATTPPSNDGSNTTMPAGNTTAISRKPEDDGSSTVTVTVIVVILVLAVVIGVGVFIFLRLRKRRMADYEKKTQIQMSSARNAGVYVDLTSAPAGDEKEKPTESPETERLNKEED